MLKQCKSCGENKVFDPTAKKDRKASGFMGAICWNCYKEGDRLRCAALYATPEGRAKIQATNKKSGGGILWSPTSQRSCNACCGTEMTLVYQPRAQFMFQSRNW